MRRAASNMSGAFQRFAAFLLLAGQAVQHGLADGQVAGGHQDHHAFAGAFEDGHLAVDADLVHPALVRESDRKTRPAFRRAATQ